MTSGGVRSIGRVTWADGVSAELFADRRWRVTRGDSEDRWFADSLAAYYEGWDRTPSLHYGQGILPDLARLMGGTSVFHAPAPDPPEVVH